MTLDQLVTWETSEEYRARRELFKSEYNKVITKAMILEIEPDMAEYEGSNWTKEEGMNNLFYKIAHDQDWLEELKELIKNK